MSNIYLYAKNSDSDNAYVLKGGKIIIEVNKDSLIEIDKKNFIFGVAELLLSQEDGFQYYRPYGVLKSQDTKYQKIELELLKKLVETYNGGLVISKSVGLELLKVNEVLTKKKNESECQEKETKEYSKIFAEVTNKLIEKYNQTKYPWLEKLSKESKKTLTYASGLAFLSFDQKVSMDLEGVDLDKFSKVFPPGAEVCRQGEVGRELYILNDGKLRVMINGTEIDTIEDRGSIVGEIALLLGEKRSASLEAVHKTVLTVVKKDNLKIFAESNPRFLKSMAIGLSRRLVNNCNLVNHLTEVIDQAKKKYEYLPEALIENKSKEEFKHLREKIQKLYEKYDIDWLEDLMLEVNSKALELSQILKSVKKGG